MENEIQPANSILIGTISAIFGAFVGIAVNYFVDLPLDLMVLTAIFVTLIMLICYVFYWRGQAHRLSRNSKQLSEKLENTINKFNEDIKKKQQTIDDSDKEINEINQRLTQEQSISSMLTNEINNLRTRFSISAEETSPSLEVKKTRDNYNNVSRLTQD
ncbi:type VI secretion system TssO [Weissella thailandensis]|uniref:Uncharacterized protein n=1 Tax=Weissella thailandensis TaxID=89061 RepID=A0ABX9I683_9LACO|nr:type VI secretion system TssO [Weissella thailandensis]NKY90118.1 hypothetical protein [Weissella thailandensis]RDS60196.1 hypothetical protein DWV05_01210 [Weissella thailandensis]GEP75039.1 hypothetical protein WTH01_12860 [Weissella thailandensis]